MIEQPRLPLDRSISEISLQINQTRTLLTALERQLDMLVGIKRGIIAPPAQPKKS